MSSTRQRIRSQRINAVPVKDKRLIEELSRSLPGDYLILDTAVSFYRLRIGVAVPKQKACIRPRCGRVFNPIRSRDVYCCKYCKHKAQAEKEKADLLAGTAPLRPSDKKVLACVKAFGPITARDIGLGIAPTGANKNIWARFALGRLIAMGLVEKSKGRTPTYTVIA
jgi:hypothetical protein